MGSSDDQYNWRGGYHGPTDDPALHWTKTFHQRKAQLAKSWDESTDYGKKMQIERMIYYAPIKDIQ